MRNRIPARSWIRTPLSGFIRTCILWVLKNTNDFLQTAEIGAGSDLNRLQKTAAGADRRDNTDRQPFRINAIQARTEERVALFQIIVIVNVIQIQRKPPRPSDNSLPTRRLTQDAHCALRIDIQLDNREKIAGVDDASDNTRGRYDCGLGPHAPSCTHSDGDYLAARRITTDDPGLHGFTCI